MRKRVRFHPLGTADSLSMPTSRRGGGVAAEFFQTRFGGRVAEDGQEQDAPQDGDGDGDGVAPVVPAGLKGGEEGGVGDGFEGGESGRGVQLVPGEKRFGDMHDHGELLEQQGLREDTQRPPAQRRRWGRNPRKW